jgi:putative transposase
MGRIARVIAVGLPHHITQRGNGRRAVFHVEEDRAVYLQLLREYGERYAVRWWGYCLMSNHVHLVAVPMKENALANALRRAHSDYARYANVKLRTSGHFWQNRYYSCPLDRIHQWTALAYVERNPYEREWSAKRRITRGPAPPRACRAVMHPNFWTWRNGGDAIHPSDGAI